MALRRGVVCGWGGRMDWAMAARSGTTKVVELVGREVKNGRRWG